MVLPLPLQHLDRASPMNTMRILQVLPTRVLPLSNEAAFLAIITLVDLEVVVAITKVLVLIPAIIIVLPKSLSPVILSDLLTQPMAPPSRITTGKVTRK